MVRIKRLVLRIFLVAEVFAFLFFYFFSASGRQSITLRVQENESLCKEIIALEQELVHLEKEIELWENNPFFKLRVAREQLHMARPTDEVYVFAEECLPVTSLHNDL